ncbi:uncharacterized protein LOC141851977 [Brevipalpus obovatus]|uniref:uncharacterized protein LOC141851977 n=1 Tax=Brevipalpus obovatus TaxID=246614 RepID=UPI003D9E5752
MNIAGDHHSNESPSTSTTTTTSSYVSLPSCSSSTRSYSSLATVSQPQSVSSSPIAHRKDLRHPQAPYRFQSPPLIMPTEVNLMSRNNPIGLRQSSSFAQPERPLSLMSHTLKVSQLPDLIQDTLRDDVIRRSEIVDDLTGARLLPPPLPLEDILRDIGTSLRQLSDNFDHRLRNSSQSLSEQKPIQKSNNRQCARHRLIIQILIRLPFNLITNPLYWSHQLDNGFDFFDFGGLFHP